MDTDTLSEASSRLSSPATRSPTPPSEILVPRIYPSPPPSQENSNKGSPHPESMDSRSCDDRDSEPPRKRRKVEPKPRTTRHLDLTTDIDEDDEETKEALSQLLNVLHKKRKIVMIVGAGISVSAGIPDFRSSKGLFNTLRQTHNLKSSGKDLFDASVYRDPTTTASFHDMVRSLSSQAKSAKPTAFHHLIATLADEGRLLRLYSQNVDGIETALPPLSTAIPLPPKAPWPKTILLHGGLEKMVCAKCHALTDFDADIFEGPIPPSCQTCVEVDEVRTQHAGKRSHGIGKLRPRMVLYNETGPDEEAIGSVTTADLRSRPDAVIVVGTTLKVPGVKRIAREMVNTVRDRRDGITVWINNEPEPKVQGLEGCWDVVVKGPCDAVARRAALRQWDDRSEVSDISEEQLQQIKSRASPMVKIESPCKGRNKAIDQTKGMLTPSASPRMRPTKITTEQPGTPSKTGRGTKAATTAKRKSIGDVLAPQTKTTTAKGAPKTTKAATAPPKTRAPPKKRAPAKKTAAANAKPNAKITNAFTASKATTQSTAKSKGKGGAASAASKPPPAALKKSDIPLPLHVNPAPMSPLPPQAVKNNTGPPYSDPDASTAKSEEGGASEGEGWSTVKVPRRHSGTISPTGTVPRDMLRLLT
ncbi:DHS-like NAD/FAD-binding domain-containing protein [Saccharata proteae CBS 121410]|uniref:DHS-like NAD/FAD-binding domain-containing protein n=1 Tax=Saccharata proteae CBS 121410 TaxID=1314787 RepID=A0A6A5YD35_9PEZI|nr:DHS-like NAD/FAD-binding domain-containing protein [Saccharata proteae CBS 121410]